MNIPNQVIASDKGHSWLGFYSLNKKVKEVIDSFLENVKSDPDHFEDQVWIVDMQGNVLYVSTVWDIHNLRYRNEAEDKNNFVVHCRNRFI